MLNAIRNEGRADLYEVVKTMNRRRVENISALAAFVCILLTNNLFAQERVSPNQPIVRDIAGGQGCHCQRIRNAKQS
jgi:hypothetical protein